MSASQASCPECTERQAKLLGLVVREYVDTALPVSSGRLVDRYDLGVSAATVRNELAALEEMGLLTHPYTSAGRVPTVAGYRYFVENLMTSARMPEPERRTIRHQFHQAGWEPERWMQLSAAVMARTSGVAGLVAAGSSPRRPIMHLEMVDIGDGLIHLVALSDHGYVRHVRWRPEQQADQASLDRISSYINNALAETGAAPTLLPPDAGELGDEVLLAIADILDREGGSERQPRLYHAGLTQIMVEPEFADSEHLKGVVEILEHGFRLAPILERLPRRGVQVIIGGEPPLQDIEHVTLVLSRFGHRRTHNGVLGVVGPTRLAYERAVSTVGFVAELMTQLVSGDAPKRAS